MWEVEGLRYPAGGRGKRAIYLENAMKNWKRIAEIEGFDIPEPELERAAPVLDGLEAAFRPLVANIPHDVEPATAFQAAPEEAGEGA